MQRGPKVSGVWAVAAAVGLVAGVAQAQLVYTSRTGQVTVYCGSPIGGPLMQHDFTTPAPTHDTVNVSDSSPGRPATTATATLDAEGSPTGLSVSLHGASTRGNPAANGAYSTADSRDTWIFTVAQRTCFSLEVTLSTTSSEAVALASNAFNLVASNGGAIEVAGGSTTTVLTHNLSAPGTWTQMYTGVLRPGTYNATIFGRSEGNSSPFSGSYASSLRLTAVTVQAAGSVSPASACENTTALFSADASGPGPITYRWQVQDPSAIGGWRNCTDGTQVVNGQVVATISGATLPTMSWLVRAGGQHVARCVVTGACDSTTTTPVVLTTKAPDINDDGNADQADVDLMINVVAGGATPNFDPDINGDGAVDQGDIDALIGWISGGDCP